MPDTTLNILYQDDCLLVIDKPHGLLSVPGIGPHNQDCVASRVQASYPDALVVHRLDCHTSGVMLMALGKANQVELNRQFHDRTTQKEYIAVVDGIVEQVRGEVDQPMRGDIDNRPRQIIDHEHGKQAITRWQRRAVEAGRSRLALFPVTGRSHQLRVHCAYMGTPIVGDRLYGIDGEDTSEPRMLLHACSLGFRHPRSGELMTVSAACEF